MAYVINFDEIKLIGTFSIGFYVNGNNMTCFDNFGVKHIPTEIKNFIGNKNIKAHIEYKHRFNNMWKNLYCIYLFFVKRQKFVRLYKFIFSLWLWK